MKRVASAMDGGEEDGGKKLKQDLVMGEGTLSNEVNVGLPCQPGEPK